ncbi:hypothetical protein ACRRTK_021745 [Alexandromys fortis]
MPSSGLRAHMQTDHSYQKGKKSGEMIKNIPSRNARVCVCVCVSVCLSVSVCVCM